ncbi:hypothetical protein [Aquicoccus sp.]|uniref:hypothetical protein n=1 Tax=Aquicoccus sp. TaxID=2055851 RepID=UPI0035665D6B
MTYRNNIVPAEVPRASNRQQYDASMTSLILSYAEAGMFPEEWCCELGITMRTLYAWAKKYPDFADALEAAWHLLHAYWARLLRENICNPGLRQTAVLKVMAKRFPATWGTEPRNTLEHLLKATGRRDYPEGHSDDMASRAVRAMTDEELEQRRVVLERRLGISRETSFE